MGYLIDTNVWSELQKGERANPGVQRWLAAVPEDEFFALCAFRLAACNRPFCMGGLSHPKTESYGLFNTINRLLSHG